jgi:uncharacterized repeat protein (TIGR01451 family)
VNFISAAGCTPAGNIVTCNLSPINPGSQTPISILVNVASSFSGTLTNTAIVRGTELDSNPSNNSVTTTTTVNRQTDLSLTHTDFPDPVTAGSQLTYTIIVGNHGPSEAVGVVVTDTLPAQVTLQSITPSQGSCIGTNCNMGTIGKGGNVTITVVVKVNDSVSGPISNTATVSGGGGSDPNTGNNSATAATFVGALQKVYLPIIIKPAPTDLSVFNDNTGGNVTFTVIGTGVSCTVPNNTTRFCGSFPPGVYLVQVTSACGNTTTPIAFESGPVTKRVFCK